MSVVFLFLHILHDITDFIKILGSFLDLILDLRFYTVGIVRNHIFYVFNNRCHTAERRISDVRSSIHSSADSFFRDTGNSIKKTSLCQRSFLGA